MYLTTSKRRRRKRKKEDKDPVLTPALIKEIVSWVLCAAGAIVLAVLLVIAFGKRMEMTGDAMAPTIMNGDSVLVNRLSYQFSEPDRDDIIAFYASGNQARTYIRRVVGLPGEKVLIENGRLYIDGEYLEDAYGSIQDAGIAAEEITLNEGEFFVLGDNRNHSEDSRSLIIGLVKKNTILGKIWRIN